MVLRGSPTGSIILVSSLREIPTVAVLHHPFLFGEIPTQFKPHSNLVFFILHESIPLHHVILLKALLCF